MAAAGEGEVEEAVGVSVEVFAVLSQDKVLQRFVEQIIDDDKVVLAGFNSVSWSRTSKRPASKVCRGSGGAVLRRGHLARAVSPGNPDFTSTSSLFWLTLALVFMRQSLEAFGRISCGFLRESADES